MCKKCQIVTRLATLFVLTVNMSELPSEKEQWPVSSGNLPHFVH